MYAVQSSNGFYKRSYDHLGGNWASEPRLAARWKTKAGAERMADKLRRVPRLGTGSPKAIEVVEIGLG